MKLADKIKFFKKEVLHYLEFFNLLDWELIFESSEDEDCRGSCEIMGELDDRMARIAYNETWLEETSCLKEISQVAFHEVLELKFSRLRFFAVNRVLNISEWMIDEEVHSFIRLFENKVFNKINKEKRK
jgi:hypothetical protein